MVAPGELLAAAKAWVLSATEADIVKPWDRKDWKMPGGAPYHPAGFMTFVGASAMVNAQTQGVYPAAKALLSAVYEGALVPFDTALRIEARWFTSVLLDPTSSAMIRSLFLNKEALEKGANRPAVPDQRVRKVGVLGAGMMGAGIAYVSANAGIEVVLIDQAQEAADRGKAYSEGLLDKGIARKKVTAEKKAEVLGRILATTDYAALEGCDLIVEAVFEDPKIKAEVTKRTEAVIPADCIFATNTSTLPISELAKASARPEQFIGIHFFSPVDKMMLVEIIKGRETGDRAVAKALDYVRQIRKTPIVVNDARFFYANRCIIPYINEGIRMVGEGVEPALIENAAKLLGFPVGPLQLVDETSIDLGVKIAKATKAAMGAAYPDDAVDAVLFWMAGEGRMGRKAKAGFYAYDAEGKRTGLWDGLAARYPVAEAQPELRDRPAPADDGAGAGGGARARGGRADRHPRGRRGRDPRLGLRAVVGRAVFLARPDRRGSGGGDLRRARGRAWRPLPRARHAAGDGDERRHLLRAGGGPRGLTSCVIPGQRHLPRLAVAHCAGPGSATARPAVRRLRSAMTAPEPMMSAMPSTASGSTISPKSTKAQTATKTRSEYSKMPT